MKWSAMVLLLVAGMACQVEVGKEDKKEDIPEETAEKKEEERVPVEVTAVARGSIEAILESTTNLEAEASIMVFARTSNPAIELGVEEGDRVEKDDVLLVLQNDSQSITLRKAKARLERAEREYKRKKELHEKELITLQEYNEADYELAQAKLEVDEAQLQLDYTVIRAPIGGTITQRMVNLGDQVNANQQLFEIVDFDSIVARVYTPEKNLGNLVLGQAARVTTDALKGRTFTGRVGRIAPTVDARTGTVKVTVMFDDPGMLRPGMYVNVGLVLDTHDNALLLPKRALVYDADQLFIFRVTADKTVERLLVQPAMMDENFVEPIEGFAEGDRIVIAGQTGLKNGAFVRVLNDEKPADTDAADQSEGSSEDAVETASAAKVTGQ